LYGLIYERRITALPKRFIGVSKSLPHPQNELPPRPQYYRHTLLIRPVALGQTASTPTQPIGVAAIAAAFAMVTAGGSSSKDVVSCRRRGSGARRVLGAGDGSVQGGARMSGQHERKGYDEQQRRSLHT
jgi:hypothetical protein